MKYLVADPPEESVKRKDPVAAERARIREELLETVQAWTAAARPSSFRYAVARDLLATLDRIRPEEP